MVQSVGQSFSQFVFGHGPSGHKGHTGVLEMGCTRANTHNSSSTITKIMPTDPII